MKRKTAEILHWSSRAKADMPDPWDKISSEIRSATHRPSTAWEDRDLESHRTITRSVRKWLPALNLLLVVVIGGFLYSLFIGQAGPYDRIMEQVFSSDHASIQFEGLDWNITEQQVKQQLRLGDTDTVYLKDNIGDVTDFRRAKPITFTSPKVTCEVYYRFYQGVFWKGEFWISVATVDEMVELGRRLQLQIDEMELTAAIRQVAGFGMLDASSIRSILAQGLGETMAWEDEAGNICRISIMGRNPSDEGYTLILEARSGSGYVG